MSVDKNNVEALRIYIFNLMTRENNLGFVMEKLSELLQSMKLNEAKNAELYYNISRLFARYCGREQTILKRTLQILETSIMLQPENAAYHAEIGHQ